MVPLPKLIMTRLLIVLFSLCSIVESAPNTNITSVLCNSVVYTRGDPFAISLSYILADLKSTTPVRQGHDYYTISPYPNAFAYGHALCTKNLTSSDCAACLGEAEIDMFNTCDSRIGARAVLYDCAIRYEQYPFAD